MSQVMVSIGGIQILIMFIALVRTKVLSVMLGPADFGVVSTIDQTVLSVMQLGALSLPFTAMKFMSRRHSEGHDKFEQTYTSFFRALTGMSILAVVTVLLLLWFRPGVFGQDLAIYRRYFYIAILGVPAAMLNILFINTLASAQRGAASAWVNMLVLLSLAVASIAGVLLGGIQGLYLVTVSTGVATTLATLWYLRRSLGLHVTAPSSGIIAALRESPQIVSYSLWIYAAMSAYSLTMLGTRYFVFAGLGAVGAGLLQALLGIALTVGAVMNPMNALFLTPLVNRNLPVADKMAAANSFAGKIILLLVVGGLSVALFPTIALTVLFSSKFATAASALYLFVLWQCLYQIANVYLQLLIGLDDIAFFTVATVVSYACATLLFPVLIARFGLGGAALALAAAMVVSAIAAALRLAFRFGTVIDGHVFFRAGFCLAAIAGAGLLFTSASELTASGILGRLGYGLVAVGALAFMLTTEERLLATSALAWGRRRVGLVKGDHV